MFKGRKLVSGFLVGILAIGLVMNAGAANLQNAKDKKGTLEQQKNQAESEKNALAEKVRSLSASMKQTEEKLGAKKSEIEEAEQEFIMAKVEENKQYESMKLRIQYMYENGNVNYIELFLESDGIVEFLNKAEYIAKLSEYDRNKLKEYQMAVRAVEEKELALQAEYQELENLQASLATQRAEAESLLAQKSKELKALEDQLKTLKDQIARAEAEENKRTSDQASQNNSSSTQQVPKPPVVSGNGFFTHPCPGMSYQSSYFGEVRQGIGDSRPHKGHDYAAPKGTPVYAAAAGTVVTAGYSNSAGNWVVIDHGNGLITKYMHMYQTPLVKAGQKVVKGQHIGGVGTTGQSTGNHLHFQVEIVKIKDGKRETEAVNPSLYM